MIKIKFSHKYGKMQLFFENYRTYLIAVSVIDLTKLPEEFLKYDTRYFESKKEKFFKLNFKKAIILTLYSIREDVGLRFETVWTTIRRWTKKKEEYYKKHIGEEVKIIVKPKPKTL